MTPWRRWKGTLGFYNQVFVGKLCCKAVVHKLLELQADAQMTGPSGETCLFRAADVDCMYELLCAQADVNQRNTRDGITPLFAAAESGSIDQAFVTRQVD